MPNNMEMLILPIMINDYQLAIEKVYSFNCTELSCRNYLLKLDIIGMHVRYLTVQTPRRLFLISNVDTGVKTSYSA